MLAMVGLLSVAFLERLQPQRVRWLHSHGDTRTDIVHALVNLGVIQFAAIVLARLGDMVPLAHRLFPVEWSLGAQLLIVAAVLDLSLYLVHRASHHWSWLWRFHAPHHRAERLYWLNGERRHPLHAVMMAGPGLVVLFAAGAPSAVVATWLGILTVHLAFQHANLDYRVGLLRYVIGVAETHRWHHKRDFEDAQVNFGEFFIFWDLLLGTFHESPRELAADEVGLRERAYPTTYLQQLVAPFLDSKRIRSVPHLPELADPAPPP